MNIFSGIGLHAVLVRMVRGTRLLASAGLEVAGAPVLGLLRDRLFLLLCDLFDLRNDRGSNGHGALAGRLDEASYRLAARSLKVFELTVNPNEGFLQHLVECPQMEEGDFQERAGFEARVLRRLSAAMTRAGPCAILHN